ncbi:MAG: cyclophilin-like fold protein [Ruminococcus sp.]|nr:cyclophilin-like fold protein [Ruminococcus sp.]
MRRNKTGIFASICFWPLMLSIMLVGCGQKQETDTVEQSAENAAQMENELNDSSVAEESAVTEDGGSRALAEAVEIEVCFGADGEPFILHLYENDTAAAIAHHVGTARWQLPIYHYDDYENWEVMQYYDVPSRYEIPSDAETVTEVKGGEVYYSEPNRIVLFYHDAEIFAEYTKVGYFDYTDEFVEAVENNPVLEGWNNKIVLIQSID